MTTSGIMPSERWLDKWLTRLGYSGLGAFAASAIGFAIAFIPGAALGALGMYAITKGTEFALYFSLVGGLAAGTITGVIGSSILSPVGAIYGYGQAEEKTENYVNR